MNCRACAEMTEEPYYSVECELPEGHSGPHACRVAWRGFNLLVVWSGRLSKSDFTKPISGADAIRAIQTLPDEEP
jgi:hypothetical protein